MTLIEADASVTHVAQQDSISTATCAAFLDNEQNLGKLLEGGASLTLPTSFGCTPLHNNSKFGRMDSICFLLRNNVDVNVQGARCYTPLLLACRSFRTDVVRQLLAADADPSLCDSCGLTLLDYTSNYQPEPKTRQEQRLTFGNTVQQLLSKDICRQNEGDRNETFLSMGECFEEARICLEQSVKKVWVGEPWFHDYICDTCSQDFPPGAGHICAACPNNVICPECYPKRATAFQPIGCDMTHQYVKIKGKKWKALANGQVSEGKTLEQWLHRQRQQLGVELSTQSNQT